MENKLPPVKKIKKNSKIKLEINANVITKLYEVLGFISKSVTPEQIEKYKKELNEFDKIIKNEQSFTEEWMISTTTITILINQLESFAEQQGLVYEEPAENTFNVIENIIKSVTEEDIPLDPQSQSQPE